MSNGDVRHSQASHFFNVTKRNENNINIKVPSTATLVGATDDDHRAAHPSTHSHLDPRAGQWLVYTPALHGLASITSSNVLIG